MALNLEVFTELFVADETTLSSASAWHARVEATGSNGFEELIQCRRALAVFEPIRNRTQRERLSLGRWQKRRRRPRRSEWTRVQAVTTSPARGLLGEDRKLTSPCHPRRNLSG